MNGHRITDDVLMIALHGVALTAAEVERIVAPLENGFPLRRVRWLFPRAPWRPITLFGGRSAMAWYDVLSWDRSRVDGAGLDEATQALTELIRSEREGRLRRGRIVLAGFSQGGSLALHAGVRLGPAVAGVVALSAALPSRQETLPPSHSGSPPFFLAHGLFDRVVPYSMGRHSMRELVARGYRVEWHSHLIGHWISERCLFQVARWLQTSVLGGPASEAVTLHRGRSVRARLGLEARTTGVDGTPVAP